MEMSGLKKKIIITISALFAIFAGAGMLYYSIRYTFIKSLPFIGGALLGAVVSIVKVLMLARVVDKSLTKDEKAAGSYVRLNHLFRLALTGAALLVAGLGIRFGSWDTSVLWGTAAGVLSYQVAIYALKFSTKKETNAAQLTSGESSFADTSDLNIVENVAEDKDGYHTKEDKAEQQTITNINLEILKRELKEELRSEIRAELEEELKRDISESEKPKEGVQTTKTED